MLGKNKDLFLGIVIFAIIASFVVGIVAKDNSAVLERVKQQLSVETDEGAKIAIQNGVTNKDWVIKGIKKGRLSIQSMDFYIKAGVLTAEDVYKTLKSTRNKSVIDNVNIGGVSYRVYIPATNEIKIATIKADLEAGKTANAYAFTNTEAKLLAKKPISIDAYKGDQEVTAIAQQVIIEDNLFKSQADKDKLVAYIQANYPKLTEVERSVEYAQKYVREVSTDSRYATIIASIPNGLLYSVPTAVVLFGVYVVLGGFKKDSATN